MKEPRPGAWHGGSVAPGLRIFRMGGRKLKLSVVPVAFETYDTCWWTWFSLTFFCPQALAEALKVNKTVTTIDLSHNGIGKEGAKACCLAHWVCGSRPRNGEIKWNQVVYHVSCLAKFVLATCYTLQPQGTLWPNLFSYRNFWSVTDHTPLELALQRVVAEAQPDLFLERKKNLQCDCLLSNVVAWQFATDIGSGAGRSCFWTASVVLSLLCDLWRRTLLSPILDREDHQEDFIVDFEMTTITAKQVVVSWDGEVNTWPDYARKVRLQWEKTAPRKRRQLGPELASRLTGRAWAVTPALGHKLLIMHCTPTPPPYMLVQNILVLSKP